MRRKCLRTAILSALACFGTNCIAQTNNSPNSPLSRVEQAVGSANNAANNALQQSANQIRANADAAASSNTNTNTNANNANANANANANGQLNSQGIDVQSQANSQLNGNVRQGQATNQSNLSTQSQLNADWSQHTDWKQIADRPRQCGQHRPAKLAELCAVKYKRHL